MDAADPEGNDTDRIEDPDPEGFGAEVTAAPEEEAPPPTNCWRCGYSFSVYTSAVCPTCGAQHYQATESALQIHIENQAFGQGIKAVMIAFVCLLLTSVFSSMIETSIIGDAAFDGDGVADISTVRSVLGIITVVEIIDTIIVLMVLAKLGSTLKSREPGNARLGWLLMLPMLGAGMAINLGYHHLINELIGFEAQQDALYAYPSLLPWLFVVVCIQPAVVEELFFRHVCLGSLRPLVGTGSAIFLSSVMFAVAHLGVYGSLPFLFALGVILGLARTISGSLLLPISIHFLHNLAVLLIGVYWQP